MVCVINCIIIMMFLFPDPILALTNKSEEQTSVSVQCKFGVHETWSDLHPEEILEVLC